MKEINMNEGSKRTLAESVHWRILGGLFYLDFQSGSEEEIFVLPLSVAKALGKTILKEIEKVEQQTGQKFDDATVSQLTPSPWESSSSPDNKAK